MEKRLFYCVDPALLPVAGTPTSRPPQPSPSLVARQSALTDWHLARVEHQRNRLLSVAGTNIYNGGACGELKLKASAGSAETPRKKSEAFDGRIPADGFALKQSKVEVEKRFRHVVSRLDPRLKRFGSASTSAVVNLLVDRLRRQLRAAGVTLGAHLEKMFKESDVDKNGVLSLAEFTDCMLQLRLLEDENECALLYDYFDLDGSGDLDIEEFKQALIGKLNDVRKAVVLEAFKRLDADGDGVITIADLKARWVPQHHPMVVAGHKTEDEVAQEILSFMDSLNPDGRVTLSEFERYYEYSSALVSDDAAFVTMVQNAWRLPGAQGGHSLKVRINQKGVSGGVRTLKQQFVEIRPPDEFNRNDPEFYDKVMRKLKEMGYHNIVNFEVMGRY